MKHTFRRVGTITVIILIACGIILGWMLSNDNIGIPKSALISNIRSSQKISPDWTIVGEASDEMAAYISYPEDYSDHIFSIYINRPGFSFGYFFRAGGSLSIVDQYISEYSIEGCSDRAFISMNTQKVDRLEIDDGNSIRQIDINSSSPFAIVLPTDAGDVTFYDVSGNTVEWKKN